MTICDSEHFFIEISKWVSYVYAIKYARMQFNRFSSSINLIKQSFESFNSDIDTFQLLMYQRKVSTRNFLYLTSSSRTSAAEVSDRIDMVE